ncbi:hypothetical protein [Myxococcus sp. CA039A]|uniref:hypothetical protein n=1 Tax=Myxococcus sp. CA039A TaxID=2741737 RepID=UPI00157A6420|nr:hypothetical protein [Myxococcus sp. CA039A]NTX57665.1 hypothetical protein [Myxococcus sp. CA039A]
MSARADKVAQKARAAMKKHGQEATLSRTVRGAYDTGTGTTAPPSVSSHSVFLMVQADSGQDKEGNTEAEGTTVRKARRKLLVAAEGLPLVPEPGDSVGPVEALTWRVLAVDPPVQLGGKPILYTLRVVAA